MKEMRLFEIGFKDKPHNTSYGQKFYIAAERGEEAIEKGRGWLIEDHMRWWEEEGREMEMAEILNDEIEEWVDGETDKWVEKRFAESPPLQAILEKHLRDRLAEIEAMALSRLHDTGTLVI